MDDPDELPQPAQFWLEKLGKFKPMDDYTGVEGVAYDGINPEPEHCLISTYGLRAISEALSYAADWLDRHKVAK